MPADVLLLGPLALFASGLLLLKRSGVSLRLAEGIGILALFGALIGAGALIIGVPSTGTALGFGPLVLQAKLDVLSVVMAVLVAFVGWIVLRFSTTYMEGEPQQRAHLAWLMLTLSSVLFLVVSAQLVQMALAWLALGYGLRQLLALHADRPAARRAAQKRRLTEIVTGVTLLSAFWLMWAQTGSLEVSAIGAAAAQGGLGLAAALLALTAIFSVALLPLHGWLLSVIEAPTPVSALLHAGVVNAGGFLLIRFADVLTTAPGILSALVVIGGASALIASLVMLTQPAIKTALAWSTVAQMGFMILQCGLALWPLALLHIVAHSMYKAYAFLNSGTAVEEVLATRKPGPVAVPSFGAVLKAFALALVIYGAVATAFVMVSPKSAQALALGAILVFGVAYLIAQGLADAAPAALTRRTVAASVIATLSYFTLQTIATWMTAGTLPPPPNPGALEWVLITLALVSFGLVALAQATFPLWARHPAAAGLRVHLMNGLYFDQLLARAQGAWMQAANPQQEEKQ